MARWRRSPLPPGWDKHIRPRILERDDWTCQLRYPGCTVVATEVHHTGDHDDHSDERLMSACRPCHATETGRAAARARYARRTPKHRPTPRHPGLM